MSLAGVGIGWREELAGFVAGRERLGFVEVVAESLAADGPCRPGRRRCAAAGSRSSPTGSGCRWARPARARPGPGRAPGPAGRAAGAPLVSEHVAFVRGGGLEAGHLLPVPRTRDALDVLAANVRLAQAELGVPLALEHVAALLEWPAPELDEAAFLTELLERTGALLLLDVANLYANARNHGGDPLAFLDRLPLERIAYVHVAGGVERDGLYHDTHAHPTPPGVLDLVAELCARTAVLDSASHATPGQPFSPEACAPPTAATQGPEPGIRDRRPRRDPPGVMLERDDD